MALIRFFFSLRAVGERGRIYPYHSNNMNKAQYHEYLLSKTWKEIRRKVFKYHGQNCKSCDGNIGIDVHHRKYERVGGQEDIKNDLIPLCRKCHDNVHQIVKVKKISIWSATQLYLSEEITVNTKVTFKRKNKHSKKWKKHNFLPSHSRRRQPPATYNGKARIRATSLIDLEKLKQMYNLEEVPDFIKS